MGYMQKQTETKKINTGKTGVILTLIAPLSIVLPLIALLIPSVRILALLLIFIPPILYVQSIVYCIHGFKKNRSRKLASTGLIIHGLYILFLLIVSIPLTPPGWMPYPLNIYKFKRACSKATFWLDFDKENIKQVQSQYLFFDNIGNVLFKSSPNAYTAQKIIQFAEANNWKYHASMPASKFQSFLNAEDIDLANTDDIYLAHEEAMFRLEINSMRPQMILMEQNDSVLFFETENYLGYPSLVVLSEKKDQFGMYYNNPARPDGPHDFSLPQSFYKYGTDYEVTQ